MMGNLLVWAIAGALIGWVVLRFVPGPPRDSWTTVVAGVAGAITGGIVTYSVLAWVSGPVRPQGVDFPALLVAILGSLALIGAGDVLMMLRGGRGGHE